ncbi:unknown [Prevotella sp. CAG:1124]|nr:unknown [Prevotella sp. CAG:1124]
MLNENDIVPSCCWVIPVTDLFMYSDPSVLRLNTVAAGRDVLVSDMIPLYGHTSPAGLPSYRLPSAGIGEQR